MAANEQLRDTISAVGSFVSLPEAFPEADPGVRLALKFEFRTEKFEDSKHPLHIDHVIYPDRLLIDLKAVDAASFDAKKLIRDCEILKEAGEKHSEKLREMIAAYAPHTPHERILEAFKTAEELGLTEAAISKSGGGFLLLLIVLAVLASGCAKDCVHTRSSTRQPEPNSTP